VKVFLKIWSRVRPFNIHSERDRRATETAFAEIVAANYPTSGVQVGSGEFPIIAPRGQA
jgi:hypothetical protein